MKIISSPSKMQAFSKSCIQNKKTIGFVPTMGALHEGHIALVKKAAIISDVVVVSIFVNPIQFGPKEDYKKYPRNIKNDLLLLKKAGVDIVFLPDTMSMFPEQYSTYIDVAGLSDKLCGISRPGHFKGVATIVSKLFNIVKPTIAFFGEKDFQQQAIIKKMVSDLNMDIKIETIKTVREKDGLAKSSRNAYLTPEERKKAPVLHESLLLAKSLIKSGIKNPKIIIKKMKHLIKNKGQIKIDYISICDPQTFVEKKIVERGRSRPAPILIAIAAFLNKTRLIDNILIES